MSAVETSKDRLHGTLDALILKTLSWGPRHGYGVARWIEDTTSNAIQVEEGHGHQLAAAACLCQRLSQPIVEQDAVGQVREGIVERLVVDQRLRAFLRAG